MGKIHSKTLQDLEFFTVLEHLSVYCNTEMGKEATFSLLPFSEEEEMNMALAQSSEYLASFENENKIPPHGFDAINAELKLLGIENTTLELPSFKRVSLLCNAVIDHYKFFKKFHEIYPSLANRALDQEPNSEIVDAIHKIIDKFGEIKDKASPALWGIRQQINEVRGKINQSFSSALSRCNSQDLLDEIRESVYDNKRVLAVKAMYRKKVKGAVMGASKTGSIVYIEPEACLRYGRELNNLEFEEREEIMRLLKFLTNFIRPFSYQLEAYQVYLAQTDLSAAKAKYADEINGILPKINQKRTLYIKDAYHPLLYLNNKRKTKKLFLKL